MSSQSEVFKLSEVVTSGTPTHQTLLPRRTTPVYDQGLRASLSKLKHIQGLILNTLIMTSNTNNYLDLPHPAAASSPVHLAPVSSTMTDQTGSYQGYGYEVYGNHGQASASPAYNGGHQQAVARYNTPRGGYMNPTARPFRGKGYHHHQQGLPGSRRRHNSHAYNQAVASRFQAQVAAAFNQTSRHNPNTLASGPVIQPAPTTTVATPTPTLSIPPPASAAQTLSRTSSGPRIDHLQTIQRELLLNFQVAATALKDMEVELEEGWAAPNVTEDRDEIYAKEAKLEILKANFAAFGRMYEETGEEIEEEWGKIYEENGSIRR